MLPLSSSELAEDREEAFAACIDGFRAFVAGQMHVQDARRLSRTVAIAGQYRNCNKVATGNLNFYWVPVILVAILCGQVRGGAASLNSYFGPK